MRTSNSILATAAVFGAFAVVFGAFAAHGLKGKIPTEALTSFDTAVKYQFYHVFALMITGVLAEKQPAKNLFRAAWFFVTGILCFSGSIYFLSTRELHGIHSPFIGIVTPIGGVLFIIAWLLLFITFYKNNNV